MEDDDQDDQEDEPQRSCEYGLDDDLCGRHEECVPINRRSRGGICTCKRHYVRSRLTGECEYGLCSFYYSISSIMKEINILVLLVCFFIKIIFCFQIIIQGLKLSQPHCHQFEDQHLKNHFLLAFHWLAMR